MQNNVNEGNVYNIETQIKGQKNPSQTGLEGWKNEVRKQLLEKLKGQNIQNIDQIIKSVFGDVLE